MEFEKEEDMTREKILEELLAWAINELVDNGDGTPETELALLQDLRECNSRPEEERVRGMW